MNAIVGLALLGWMQYTLGPLASAPVPHARLGEYPLPVYRHAPAAGHRARAGGRAREVPP
jgi:hypothetical protein